MANYDSKMCLLVPLPPTHPPTHSRVSRDFHVLTFYYNGSPDILPFDLYCSYSSCAYYVHLDMYLFNNIPRPPSPPLPLKSRGFLFIYLHLFIYHPSFLNLHTPPTIVVGYHRADPWSQSSYINIIMICI